MFECRLDDTPGFLRSANPSVRGISCVTVPSRFAQRAVADLTTYLSHTGTTSRLEPMKTVRKPVLTIITPDPYRWKSESVFN